MTHKSPKPYRFCIVHDRTYIIRINKAGGVCEYVSTATDRHTVHFTMDYTNAQIFTTGHTSGVIDLMKTMENLLASSGNDRRPEGTVEVCDIEVKISSVSVD